MPEVKGFRGLRYNKAITGTLDKVITPPFDVISPIQRTTLWERSPYNMVRLILPEERDRFNKYQAAARDLEMWLARSVLRQDAQPSFYLLEQTFRGPDNLEHRRRGFFAAVRIPEEGEQTVLGHERTFDYKVSDRLALTEATQANLGAVFVMYEDASGDLGFLLDQMYDRPEDDLARTIDGVTQRIWRVGHDDRVTEFFRNKTLYIADGHHRFRTAQLYRDRMRAREQPNEPRGYDYVLMGLVAFDDPGLIVYPAHRVLDAPNGFDRDAFLRALGEWFEITRIEDQAPQEVQRAEGCTIGMCIHGDGQYLLALKEIDRRALLGDDRSGAWRDLDVAVLHRGILENILELPPDAEFVYEVDTEQALDLVESGARDLAFFVKPATVQQIRACADAGDPMPQKSTYLFPKLPSGGVIHKF